MAIRVAVAYWNACLKKLRKFLRSEKVCELHLCKPPENNKNPGYYCVVRIRNLMFVVVILALLFLYRGSKYHIAEFDKILPRNSLVYLQFEEKKYPELSIHDIKSMINVINTNETIENKCAYEGVKWNKVIFVIQVNKITVTLKYLLVSLSQIKGIEEILLIFSHSYFDMNLIKLIRSIDFCRVQQIFYPYSLQVNPVIFPSQEANDCPYDMDVQKAAEVNCTGAFTPDARGFYRHPERAQKKHHWWWTANKVFEDLKFCKNQEGMVVFLDDDLYLLQDFLYLTLYMQRLIRSLPHCEFLSLATPTGDRFKEAENITFWLQVEPFNPDYHSTALAFNMDTWNKIVGYYDMFCNIDEYSWSKSLFQLSKNITFVENERERFKVMSSALPRAYKISYDGLFERLNERAVFETVFQILKMQEELEKGLFPESFKIHVENEARDDDLKEEILSGGFNDPRDKRLCINMTVRKIKKVFFDMANQFL